MFGFFCGKFLMRDGEEMVLGWKWKQQQMEWILFGNLENEFYC
jgi:hypothetical protein